MRHAEINLARNESYEAHLAYRVRVLPKQLATARAKVRKLEEEAQRYGMTDLLERRQ